MSCARARRCRAPPADALPFLCFAGSVKLAFHPAVDAWFRGSFGAPTDVQARGWPAIQSGRHALLAAPTGSGKTLAAFLCAIDALVQLGVQGALEPEVYIVYVSPLKALGNDIEKNLAGPLAGIREELARRGEPDVDIRVAVRTGDTSARERTGMTKRPPHILVTTPESLYILLTSAGGRRALAKVRTVIVDEIHALAPNKRGAHLALSLERLEALTGRALVRIGLSATQAPIEAVARFLVGARDAPCTIVDLGHTRTRDLAIEMPGSPLETVASGALWEEIYARIAALALEHRTTLVFVNTRRLAERIAFHLGGLLGKNAVSSHHGSLSREHRLEAEGRLKAGSLRVLVATASLELGIDIGDVDLVVQVGVTRSIATALQRIGRASHGISGVPKGRFFPTNRDELVEIVALLACVRRGELDRLVVPRGPTDILAQQIVAAVAAEDWDLGRSLRARRACVSVRGPHARRARRRRADARGRLRDGARAAGGARPSRRGARRRPRQEGRALVAITSGGAIPDVADYEVVLEPNELRVGSLHEDFAIESSPGDIFQLGNVSYRILRVERGKVRVADARGAPPTIPFWIGESPGTLGRALACGLRAPGRRERGVRRRDRRSAGPAARDGGGRRRAAAARRLPAERGGLAGRHALAGVPRYRALFRRDGRDAPRPARPVRLAREPRVGARPPEVLLQEVRLRAPGRGDRRCDRAQPRPHPCVPRRGGLELPPVRHGPRRARAGRPRRPHLRDSLAVERLARPRDRALPGREEGPGPVPEDGRRGPAHRLLPRAGRLSRERRRRPRDPQPPPRHADHRRLPHRGDGRRGVPRCRPQD